jgi:cytoskeleton protein RodZ
MTRDRPPAGVGAKLQEARERREVSLDQVADSTKISVSILHALECNDISRLPGGVLGRGFVRSFATAVGLDPEATVAEFVAQFPLDSVKDGYPAAERVDKNEPPDTRPSEASIKIRRWEASTLLRLAAVGVLPAALVVYFGTTRRWPQRAASQSRAATAQAGLADHSVRLDGPGENSVRAAGSDESSVQTQRSGEPSTRSAAPDLPTLVNALADSTAARAVPAGGDSTPVATSSASTVDFAPDSSPANAESSADAKRGEKPDAGTLVGDRLAVVLSVTRPSWVIATVDGKKTVNRLLEVGEQETLEARRNLVLTAGDGGAIVMTLNGVVAKSLGRTDETVTARVNLANFRDYLRRDEPPRQSH